MKRVCNVIFSFFLLICMCFGSVSCINNPQYVRAELVRQWSTTVNCQLNDGSLSTSLVHITFDFEGGYELSISRQDTYIIKCIDEKGTYSIWQNTIQLKPDEKNDYTEKDGYTDKLSYVYNKYTGELSLYYLGEKCY